MMIFMAATRPKHGRIVRRAERPKSRAARASAGGQMWKLPQDDRLANVQFPAARGQNGFVDFALVDWNVLDSSIEPTPFRRRHAQRGLFQCRPEMRVGHYFRVVQYEIG